MDKRFLEAKMYVKKALNGSDGTKCCPFKKNNTLP